ncbi:MAG: 6,7-dimethyl-8-ribityllumazine synthase [Candidatus Nanohaloarchaea archaeon]
MMDLGLVVAKFNRSVTEEMEEKAEEKAEELEFDGVEKLRVPGSYDTVLAADRLARKEEIDAVTVVGAIVEGDTHHDRVIADATAKSLQDVSRERDKPVTLGITGPSMSGAEARERTDYGANAVEAAAEMLEELE